MDPWQVPLIVVSDMFSSTERAALSRDHDRRLVRPVRPGVWVRCEDVADLEHPEDRHPVRMRALAATSREQPMFSHASAAVGLGMSPYRRSLDRVSVLVRPGRSRSRVQVRARALPWSEQEVTERHGLLMTDVARTVVDIAMTSARGEGIAAVDEALRSGLRRELLEEALERAVDRRAIGRARDAVAFGHPGGESAAESDERWSMFLLGLEPPELQFEIRDDAGVAGVVDTLHRRGRLRIATEVDGARKFLDRRLATEGAGIAVYREKLREDRVRAQLDGLARPGWREASTPSLLLPMLRTVGLQPPAHPPTLADYATAARDARPRRLHRLA